MSYRDEILSDSPVAYWRLNDDPGSGNLPDETGNYTAIARDNPTFGVAGLIENDDDTAVELDDAWIELPHISELVNTDQFTIELWTDIPFNDNFVSFFHFVDASNNEIFLFGLSGDEIVIRVDIGGSSRSSDEDPIDPNDYYDGRHHIVMRYDGSTLELIVDTVVRISLSASGTIDYSSSGEGGGLGALDTGSLQLDGVYDEFAVYDYALSNADIQRHYDFGIGEINLPPNQPTITAKSTGATTAQLNSSVFSDPNEEDTHEVSQWRVRRASDDVEIYDSGESDDLTEHNVSELSAGEVYKAEVRHQDDGGEWSEWSEPDTFKTDTWDPCDLPSNAAWESCPTPEPIIVLDDVFLWLQLNEESSEEPAEDSSGNDRDGEYQSGVIDFGLAGPEEGSLAVEVNSDSGQGVTVDDVNWSGEGGNFSSIEDADSDPNYIVPEVHTNFTLRISARPTVETFVPDTLSDPVGTGHIIDDADDEDPNRFITNPAHGNRDNSHDIDDIHAGAMVALGTNAILVCEHAHNHVIARAVYEADLSDWHVYHIVYRGTPTDSGTLTQLEARIYIDGVYAGNLSGEYREGPSIKDRPFLDDPLLTVTSGVDWVDGFVGLVNDFRVFNRALTDEEITSDFSPTSVIGSWEECPTPPSESWSPC